MDMKTDYDYELLAPPTKCDDCNSTEIILKSNDYGNIYQCNNCGASVGCHVGTKAPLGRMASAKIRKLRIDVHKEFDPIWRKRILRRPDAYDWLGRQLGIERSKCHMSMLTEEQLTKAIEVSKEFMRIEAPIHQRRLKKRNAKLKRQIKRERSIVRVRRENT